MTMLQVHSSRPGPSRRSFDRQLARLPTKESPDRLVTPEASAKQLREPVRGRRPSAFVPVKTQRVQLDTSWANVKRCARSPALAVGRGAAAGAPARSSGRVRRFVAGVTSGRLPSGGLHLSWFEPHRPGKRAELGVAQRRGERRELFERVGSDIAVVDSTTRASGTDTALVTSRSRPNRVAADFELGELAISFENARGGRRIAMVSKLESRWFSGRRQLNERDELGILANSKVARPASFFGPAAARLDVEVRATRYGFRSPRPSPRRGRANREQAFEVLRGDVGAAGLTMTSSGRRWSGSPKVELSDVAGMGTVVVDGGSCRFRVASNRPWRTAEGFSVGSELRGEARRGSPTVPRRKRPSRLTCRRRHSVARTLRTVTPQAAAIRRARAKRCSARSRTAGACRRSSGSVRARACP